MSSLETSSVHVKLNEREADAARAAQSARLTTVEKALVLQLEERRCLRGGRDPHT